MMALTAPLEGTREELERFLQDQPKTQRFRLTPLPALSEESKAGSRYPNDILQEYRTLTAKRRNASLTSEEAEQLEEVKAQINAIDAARPRPDVWDKQSERLRQEMAEIREQIRAHSQSDGS
jgi:hypothetical protein